MLDADFPTAEDEREFYAAVGKAITSWADLEAILFQMTHAILGCTKERAAIVFYRTPTIDSRLTLTNDLVNSFFPKHGPGEHPDPRIKRWREIQAEIREHLPDRNRLAHHPVGPTVNIYMSFLVAQRPRSRSRTPATSATMNAYGKAATSQSSSGLKRPKSISGSSRAWSTISGILIGRKFQGRTQHPANKAFRVPFPKTERFNVIIREKNRSRRPYHLLRNLNFRLSYRVRNAAFTYICVMVRQPDKSPPRIPVATSNESTSA